MGPGWDALGWDRVSTLESWLMDRGSVGGNEGMTGTPAKDADATRMSIHRKPKTLPLINTDDTDRSG
jgi:hypothetical protein